MTPERESQMRDALAEYMRNEDIHGGYVSTRDFDAGFRACARALEPMVRDGERYRFLRDADNPLCIYLYKTSIACGSTGVADVGEVIASRDADNVLDTAMSAALEEEKNANE